MRLGIVLLVLGACGETRVPVDSAVNEPAQWAEATDELTIGEGQTRSLALTGADPEGGPVSFEVRGASAGLEVTAGETLVIRAGYAVGGSLGFTLAVLDDAGAEMLYEVTVEVLPLRWLDYQSWGADGPEEREHPTVVVDAAARQAFLIQGSGYHPQFEQMLDDVWRHDLDAGGWTEVTPVGPVPVGAGSRRFAGAFGAGTGLLFGGYGPPPAAYADLHRVAVEGSTLRFEEVAQIDPPPARFLHAFAFDPALERYFLFGGVSNVVLGDTWMMELDAAGAAVWTNLEIAGPSPRYGAFYGFDEQQGRLVLYAGAQAPVAGDPVNAASDTWVLSTRSDPPVWTLIADAAASPPGRRNGSAVWDEPSSRLFVFGGTADGATTQEGLFVFDARPGADLWHTLSLPDGPPVRSSGVGFHDGERAYLGFGNSDAVYRDLAVLGH